VRSEFQRVATARAAHFREGMNTSSISITGRRSNNEDNFLSDSALQLFAVADGLGGYDAGEVASALAVEAMSNFVRRVRRDPEGTWPGRGSRHRTFDENVLAMAALEAHRSIWRQKEGTSSQMGSTVAAVLLEGTTLSIAHVGDSRVYLLRDGALKQLTVDHSFYAQLVASGSEVPPRHLFAYKNQITRALGLTGDHAADTSFIEVREGDRLLLCTDGLYDPFTDEALAALVPGGDSRGACQRLVDAAFAAGSHDNITAIVVDV